MLGYGRDAYTSRLIQGKPSVRSARRSRSTSARAALKRAVQSHPPCRDGPRHVILHPRLALAALRDSTETPPQLAFAAFRTARLRTAALSGHRETLGRRSLPACNVEQRGLGRAWLARGHRNDVAGRTSKPVHRLLDRVRGRPLVGLTIVKLGLSSYAAKRASRRVQFCAPSTLTSCHNFSCPLVLAYPSLAGFNSVRRARGVTFVRQLHASISSTPGAHRP
jgi:hypothetical protein